MRFQSHFTSLLAEVRAMNSKVIEESDIHVCFLEYHEFAINA